MKPGKPLRRYARLERSTPLTGGTPPKRSGRLRPVSAKRQQENRERRAMADELYPGRREQEPVKCVVPWCTRWADDLHEPLTRARQGSITDPDNGEPTCRRHNSELTEEPSWGYTLHLLVHSWDKRSPAQIAADRREAIARASEPAECGVHVAFFACETCTACRLCGPCGCELINDWAREAS